MSDAVPLPNLRGPRKRFGADEVLRGLRKRFGADEVLRGIDLDVMPGDRIAILGASGSGTSTLLRCLTVMEVPTEGTQALASTPVDTRDEAALVRVSQRVGLVFQPFNLFPHMTATGNVMEGLVTVKRQPAAQARERARQELSRAGLADKADAWQAAGSTARECDLTLAQVYSADEAFVTGTLIGVTPVVRIDGRVIGNGQPGPMTAPAAERYWARVEAEAG